MRGDGAREPGNLSGYSDMFVMYHRTTPCQVVQMKNDSMNGCQRGLDPKRMDHPQANSLTNLKLGGPQESHVAYSHPPALAPAKFGMTRAPQHQRFF